MKAKLLVSVLLTLFLMSCGGDGNDGGLDPGEGGIIDESNKDWLIPVAEIKDGGPGRDGIPSIDEPIFLNPFEGQNDFMRDFELVIGIVINGEARAYPHIIMDWHEIVNDHYDDVGITLSYCPLTGTAFGWSSVSNNTATTFGVSGLLYNANLILYDRNTGSNWSQLKLQCVNGSLIGDEPILIDVIETNWGTWKSLYPDTKLLSLETGFDRDYGMYPYGPYRGNHEYFIFPAFPRNEALPSKERVYAILDGEESKVYRLSSFESGKSFRDSFKGKDYLIVGNEHVIHAYEMSAEYDNLEFEYEIDFEGSFFKDNEGNKWSISGLALEGPRAGTNLKVSRSVTSYWFAVAAFYPNPEIYEGF